MYLTVLIFLSIASHGLIGTGNGGGVQNSTATLMSCSLPDGLHGDGLTDDAPALRKAIESCSGKLILPKGTFLIGTLSETVFGDNRFALPIHSAIEIDGSSGAVLKVADGLLNDDHGAPRGGALFLCNGLSKVHIHDLTIDMNGEKNLVPSGKVRTGFALRFSNCSDSIVQRVRIVHGPGRNDIVFRGGLGTNNQVLDNVVEDGGTALAGNQFQDDYSAIYVDSANTLVQGNSILTSRDPSKNHGGIELHASGDEAIANYIERGIPGIYIASDKDGEATQNQRAIGNNCEQCLWGIAFAGTSDFINTEIRGNLLTIRSMPGAMPGTAYGILHSRDDKGEFAYSELVRDCSIAENVIRDARALSTSPPDRADSVGMKLSSLQHCSITNNVLGPLAAESIQLQGSPMGLTSVEVSGNSFGEFGSSRSTYDHYAVLIDLRGSSSKPRKEAYDATNLSFHHNSFLITHPLAGHAVAYWDWSDASVVHQVGFDGSNNSNLEQLYSGGKRP
jgi:hypothetical protein